MGLYFNSLSATQVYAAKAVQINKTNGTTKTQTVNSTVSSNTTESGVSAEEDIKSGIDCYCTKNLDANTINTKNYKNNTVTTTYTNSAVKKDIHHFDRQGLAFTESTDENGDYSLSQGRYGTSQTEALDNIKQLLSTNGIKTDVQNGVVKATNDKGEVYTYEVSSQGNIEKVSTPSKNTKNVNASQNSKNSKIKQKNYAKYTDYQADNGKGSTKTLSIANRTIDNKTYISCWKTDSSYFGQELLCTVDGGLVKDSNLSIETLMSTLSDLGMKTTEQYSDLAIKTDGNGNVASVVAKDENGEAISFEYKDGKLFHQKEINGKTVNISGGTISDEELSELVGNIDLGNNELDISVDDNGMISKLKYGNHSESFVYGYNGEYQKVISEDGNLQVYSYNKNNESKLLLSSSNNQITFSPDENTSYNINSSIDNEFILNNLANVTKLLSDIGDILSDCSNIEITTDDNGNISGAKLLRNNQEITLEYHNGNLYGIQNSTDEQGNAVTNRYNLDGSLAEKITECSETDTMPARTVSETYDENGNLASVTTVSDSIRIVESYSDYQTNENGNTVRKATVTSNENGIEETKVYTQTLDSQDRVAIETSPDKTEINKYTYCDDGNIIINSEFYDENKKLIKTQQIDNEVIVTQDYDAETGLVTSLSTVQIQTGMGIMGTFSDYQTDENGNTIRKATVTSNENGTEETKVYTQTLDSQGRVSEEINADNTERNFYTYREDGSLEKIQSNKVLIDDNGEPFEDIAGYLYDESGNLSRISHEKIILENDNLKTTEYYIVNNPNGNPIEQTYYDPINKQAITKKEILKKNEDGSTEKETYVYNEDGTHKIDKYEYPKGAQNAQRHYSYLKDSNGNVISYYVENYSGDNKKVKTTVDYYTREILGCEQLDLDNNKLAEFIYQDGIPTQYFKYETNEAGLPVTSSYTVLEGDLEKKELNYIATNYPAQKDSAAYTIKDNYTNGNITSKTVEVPFSNNRKDTMTITQNDDGTYNIDADSHNRSWLMSTKCSLPEGMDINSINCAQLLDGLTHVGVSAYYDKSTVLFDENNNMQINFEGGWIGDDYTTMVSFNNDGKVSKIETDAVKPNETYWNMSEEYTYYDDGTSKVVESSYIGTRIVAGNIDTYTDSFSNRSGDFMFIYNNGYNINWAPNGTRPATTISCKINNSPVTKDNADTLRNVLKNMVGDYYKEYTDITITTNDSNEIIDVLGKNPLTGELYRFATRNI